MHIKLRDGRLVRVIYHGRAVYKSYTRERLLDRSEWDERLKHYVTMFDVKSDEVEEVFEVFAGVIYGTGIMQHSNEWTLDNENEVWTGSVYLHGGNYPGWEFVDRGEGRKLVSLKECSGQFMKKRTFIRNGKELNPDQEKKVQLSLPDFKRGIVFYNIGEPVKKWADYEGEPFLFQDPERNEPSILEGLKAWKNG